MNTLISFNTGGTLSVTPAGSGAFDVTIAKDTLSETYSTAFDTNVATTIDNFIAAHAANIDERWGILLTDGATTLDMHGINGFDVTSDTASVGSITFANEKHISDIVSVVPATATTVTLSLNVGSAPSAGDVATVTFASEARRNQFINEELVNAKQAANRGAAFYVVQVANSISLA